MCFIPWQSYVWQDQCSARKTWTQADFIGTSLVLLVDTACRCFYFSCYHFSHFFKKHPSLVQPPQITWKFKCSPAFCANFFKFFCQACFFSVVDFPRRLSFRRKIMDQRAVLLVWNWRICFAATFHRMNGGVWTPHVCDMGRWDKRPCYPGPQERGVTKWHRSEERDTRTQEQDWKKFSAESDLVWCVTVDKMAQKATMRTLLAQDKKIVSIPLNVKLPTSFLLYVARVHQIPFSLTSLFMHSTGPRVAVTGSNNTSVVSKRIHSLCRGLVSMSGSLVWSGGTFTRPVNYDAAFSPKRSRFCSAIKKPTLMPTKQYPVNTKGNKNANKACQESHKWNFKSECKTANGGTNEVNCVNTSPKALQSSAELSEELELSRYSSGGTGMCVPSK